jgi:hypothetical protein
MLILIIVIVLLFGLGGGYWGHRQYGEGAPYAGPGIGIGAILLILLICYLLGILR